jgi:hypothetical protein
MRETKKVYCNPEIIIEAFITGNIIDKTLIEVGLPDDAIIEDVYYEHRLYRDSRRDQIVFIVSSEKFDTIEDRINILVKTL